MRVKSRFGLIIPSTNTTMEPEFYAMAPEGVSIHFSRFKHTGTCGTLAPKDFRNELRYVRSATRILADVKPDVIGFGCTSESMVGGKRRDEEIIKTIEDISHVPAITTASAVVAGLRDVGVQKVSIVTPFLEWLNQKHMEFFQEYNIEVSSIVGGYKPPASISEFVKDNLSPDADGVFISCTDLPTVGILEQLEFDIKKPVISSNQATMWMMLRKARVRVAVDRFGSLMSG